MADVEGHFDNRGFFRALEATVLARGLKWKDVSAGTGISTSTLSRMVQGKGPDAAGLAVLRAPIQTPWEEEREPVRSYWLVPASRKKTGCHYRVRSKHPMQAHAGRWRTRRVLPVHRLSIGDIGEDPAERRGREPAPSRSYARPGWAAAAVRALDLDPSTSRTKRRWA